MKTKIVLSVLFLLLMNFVFAQTDTTVVEEQGGFWGFYNKYSAAIFLVLGTSGAAVYFWARAKRLLNAIKVLIVAGDDTSPQGKIVTQEEWNGIIAAFKGIFGKLTEEEKNEVVQEIKNKQR